MPPMILTISLLLGSAVVIYLACEFFVNGVEWVGRKFSVGQHATGSILAAFGTALPESVVTFIAVVFGVTAAQKSIGVGAGVTAAAVAVMFVAFRRGFISRVLLAAMAGLYGLFAVIILVWRL